jgi:CubicO group peptidase (beta-lactamase class C family)
MSSSRSSWTLVAAFAAVAIIAPAESRTQSAAQTTRTVAPDTTVRASVATIDSIASQLIAARKAPGMAVLVLRGNATLLARGYGSADLASARTVDASSIFRVGSITKQFTAAMVLQLVAAGKIRIDDSLHRFLPELGGPTRNATIHQLLTHTSGIPNYTELGWFRSRGRSAIPRAEMIRLLDAEPLRFPHGAQWAYNNSAYYLLGAVIERVTGESYASQLRRAIVTPLALRHTGYCDSTDGVAATVTGYDLEGDAFDAVAPMDMANPFTAGALCSSAGDLATWMTALLAGRVVPDSLVRRMLTPVQVDGRRAQYGYGMELSELGGQRRIGHGGSLPGFDSYVAHYPDAKLTVVVLTNSSSANAEAIEKTLARRLLGIAEPSFVEVPLTASALTSYVGSYRAGPGRVIVSVHGQRLHVAGPVEADLAHVGDHTFVMTEEPDVRLVFRVEGGSATSIAWTSRGRTLTLPRMP